MFYPIFIATGKANLCLERFFSSFYSRERSRKGVGRGKRAHIT